MVKEHGYLLPAGDAFTEELSCALVFYPDKEEYRRALLGALTYFQTWIAWERDDDKRGKDAARAWALANFCTMECWDMACIDELLETMEAVRVLLSNRKDCCDDNVTYGLQEEFDTDIDPGVGDPPDYYGETAIVDWDDWWEHVCYNAHLYVDNLKNMSSQLNGAVEQNSLYLGLIAAGLALLAFSGVGAPVAYLLASFVVTGLVLAVTSATFASSSDDIEAAREDIVCVLLQGGDLAGEVEEALGSGAAWDLFYKFVDYDSATAIIHEGGADGDYLPTETRDDCECDPIYDYSPFWDFDSEIESPWTSTADWAATCGGSSYMNYVNKETHCDTDTLREFLELSAAGTLVLHGIDWVWRRSTAVGTQELKIVGVQKKVHTGTVGNCVPESMVFDPPITLPSSYPDVIEFAGGRSDNYLAVCDITLYIDLP